MVKRVSQSDHDAMVRKIMEDIIKSGYLDVMADLPKVKKPMPINNYIPDVTGKVSSWLFIYEIETDDSIEDSHTEMQWKAFAKNAEDNGGRFVVVVPRGSKKKAENRLKELEINAQIMEINLNKIT